MKQIVCLYCEGSEAKLAYIEKNNGSLKIERVASVPLSQALHAQASLEKSPAFNGDELTTEISFDKDQEDSFSRYDSSDVGLLANALTGLNVKKLEFIPIITEPTVNFHPSKLSLIRRKTKLLILSGKIFRIPKAFRLMPMLLTI